AVTTPARCGEGRGPRRRLWIEPASDAPRSLSRLPTISQLRRWWPGRATAAGGRAPPALSGLRRLDWTVDMLLRDAETSPFLRPEAVARPRGNEGVSVSDVTLPGLHHVALTVTDLDAAVPWYEKAFGLKFQME